MMLVRRARPLLGTLVEMRVEGLTEHAALRALEASFAEVALIHRLMSFHESESDLARVHRACVSTPVRIDARTRAVLACALDIACASDGCFDPTIAALQVTRGALPRPVSPFTPDPHATWRDIELRDDAVCLQRPLWIDLGGIAKGYAVDRATEILLGAGALQACVNAGGDLRIAGPRAEHIHVRDAHGRATAVVELANGAIASSTSALRGSAAQHVHGLSQQCIRGGTTVSVVAPHCMIADALTKVVLAQGDSAVCARFGALARVHDSACGARIGAAA
jgi:thiamine biosynthesis lipoprotein